MVGDGVGKSTTIEQKLISLQPPPVITSKRDVTPRHPLSEKKVGYHLPISHIAFRKIAFRKIPYSMLVDHFRFFMFM